MPSLRDAGCRDEQICQFAAAAAALSVAAEVQWSLLPPLSCSTDRLAVSGTKGYHAHSLGATHLPLRHEAVGQRLDLTEHGFDTVGAGGGAVAFGGGLGAGGEEFFFLGSKFLWRHELLFD